MNVPVSTAQRGAFYRAAHRGLLALDARERTPRRFGAEADARWRSFQGHLGVADRLDILLRDAAVQWTSGFSPALVFDLPGLAADEPFGPDWTPLPAPEAERLWAETGQPVDLAAVADILGIPSTEVDLPPLAATTRLVVAGGAAVAAVAAEFAANGEPSRELSWSDQVVVVAADPAVRQFAGLVAPLLSAQGPTGLVLPTGEVGSAFQKLGLSGGGHPVVSNDATPEEQAFARAATGGS